MYTVIHTQHAPKAIGPYSQAISANGFVFASGQIPVDPATGEIAGDTIESQTEQVLVNLHQEPLVLLEFLLQPAILPPERGTHP